VHYRNKLAGLSIYYTDIKIQEDFGMARGQRKTIEEKLAEKEKLIDSLKIRLRSEQRELEELRKEQREAEMKALQDILQETNLSAADAAEVLRGYLAEKNVSA
jgi:peptidoglycan hydrolase CwlO-like protein